MGTIFGYARCSTNESRQDISRQERDLISMGAARQNIYWEYEKGSKQDRVEFQKLLSLVQQGDTIACTEVSRLTRSTRQLCEVIQLVKDKQLKLIIGTFTVDCSKGELDVMTEGMLKMMGVFAEMEIQMASARIKSGLENAVAKGKKLGRPELTIDNLPSNFFRYYPQYSEGKMSKAALARVCKCSRQSIYSYIKLYEESLL